MLKLVPNPERSDAPRQLVFQLAPETPFTYCRICGSTFIHPSTVMRQVWSFQHAQKHPQRQHDLLIKSNLWLLPDAAHKLASAGVISVTDLVMDNEVAAALYESSPILPNGP